jgi:hypothetical protein
MEELPGELYANCKLSFNRVVNFCTKKDMLKKDTRDDAKAECGLYFEDLQNCLKSSGFEWVDVSTIQLVEDK